MIVTKYNAKNERIKREYFAYLKQAHGRDESTIDRIAASLARFEESTRAKGFDRFHREQAVAFKARLAEQRNKRTGEAISKATILATLRDLRSFFFWLAHQPGFKSRIHYSDADYFNLSDKDVTIARARRDKRVPTLDQVQHILAAAPHATPLERRDRALIAFTAVTGARIDALVSLRLRHVDLAGGFIEQDARHVRTKFSKSFRTYFLPIGGDALTIAQEWVGELTRDHFWGLDDPLFPSTEMGLDGAGGFRPVGLLRKGWAGTGPARDIFKRAFERAGLPYYNPHSFRDMLVHHAMSLNLTPEAMKALSQNLGHNDVLTTFTSYGKVPLHRQVELIRSAGARRTAAELEDPDAVALLDLLLAKRAAKAAA